jgi:hypothetical protein
MFIRPDCRELPLYDFIFSFKYLEPSDLKMTSAEVKRLSQTELETLAPVTKKWVQAKQQLLDYQACFKSKGYKELKLQLITVLAVGFKKVLWQTVLEPNDEVSGQDKDASLPDIKV